MAKFDRQVDRARQIADRLAREYTNRDVQAVS
jgi:chromosomal replication initiation ATPase DnaA